MEFPPTTTTPYNTPNAALVQKAMSVMEHVRLLDNYGPWTAVSNLRNSVKHSNPAIRKMLQKNVDECGKWMILMMYFSLWDTFFEAGDMANLYQNWMTRDEEVRFKAFKHVRHSGVHNLLGKRARNFGLEFETVMSGSASFNGVTFDQTNIDISASQIDTDCRLFFLNLSKNLVARLANNKTP